MIKKILVAYDDGILAQKALEAAIDIAKNNQAEIHLVSAYALPIVYQSTLSLDGIYPDNTAVIDYLYQTNRTHLEKILLAAAAQVSQENIPVATQLLDGSPGRMIIQYAEDQKIDLIAAGSHNRTAVDRFFMGSVSNYILHHARGLVLIAKGD